MRKGFGDVYAKTIREYNISCMYSSRGAGECWIGERIREVVQSHCLPLFFNSGRGVSVSSHVNIIVEKIAK